MNGQIQYWCKQTNPRIKLPLVPTHWSIVTDVYLIHWQRKAGSLYDSSVLHRVCFSVSQLRPSNAPYRLPCNSESTYLVQSSLWGRLKNDGLFRVFFAVTVKCFDRFLWSHVFSSLICRIHRMIWNKSDLHWLIQFIIRL